ncbi:hypothetical protein RJ55_00609 [Drechmeria coniospora]|nr:hypothetical protein RJ55_00609 [Drechmeria coniospora]
MPALGRKLRQGQTQVGVGFAGKNSRSSTLRRQRLAHQNKMAPAAGAKKQKKKWSKGKVKDKAQHAVILDKATSEKLYKDVLSYRLVTVAVLVDRMKINGSLARKCIIDLEEKGMIKPVVTHSKMKIYTRAVGAA